MLLPYDQRVLRSNNCLLGPVLNSARLAKGMMSMGIWDLLATMRPTLSVIGRTKGLPQCGN
jgi:hypothetical protein